MSTRSVIIRYNAESGNFDCAYKHHDGYGNTGYLNLFYNTPEKAQAFLEAIMQPNVELRQLGATVEGCRIADDMNGYHSFEAPAPKENLEKYIPASIRHCDAEFITLYTPKGWKEFALLDCVYFSEKRIKEEEDLAYLSRMLENNKTLEVFVEYLRSLATNSPLPEADDARPGEILWGYIWGDKNLTPEQKLHPLGSAEAQNILDHTARSLFGCTEKQAWKEFTACTGAKLLYVAKSREICFKINPRYMANKANVVKAMIWPGNHYGSAEFYKVTTGKYRKKITYMPCECSGYLSGDKYSFLENFRQQTALATHFPASSPSTYSPIPAWEIVGYTPITNYWQKLYSAARQGADAVKRLATGLFDSAKHSYKHLTELVLVLNHLCWKFAESNDTLGRLFASLYHTANDYARANLTGEELEYYFRITD